ncbi:peptidase E [Glycomyces buryatensis]|uniref:Peptidase E n=1 Tax=Glycomyces buryatensis TaxID=2570927 RepID=A0A4S8QKY1_9ACTN|nr:peptidase E [Glycomyces buryatensis]THV41384.1 peptidase E [Glycomyces buryatensis]
MVARTPTIVAGSMGFDRTGRNAVDWRPGKVFRVAFDLAEASEHPRVCFIATAGGDPERRIAGFYGAFAGSGVECSHLTLFEMPNVEDVAAHLLAQDMIWVDRGSLVNLVAIWKSHRLPEVLKDCWQAGVVLGGESAGSLCWHTGGSTDSFGPKIQAAEGIGFLPYSNAVHYSHRKKAHKRLIAEGALDDGYATDAGAALVYRGTELAEVVADRKDAYGYHLARNDAGQVVEKRIEPRPLS